MTDREEASEKKPKQEAFASECVAEASALLNCVAEKSYNEMKCIPLLKKLRACVEKKVMIKCHSGSSTFSITALRFHTGYLFWSLSYCEPTGIELLTGKGPASVVMKTSRIFAFHGCLPCEERGSETWKSLGGTAERRRLHSVTRG